MATSGNEPPVLCKRSLTSASVSEVDPIVKISAASVMDETSWPATALPRLSTIAAALTPEAPNMKARATNIPVARRIVAAPFVV